MAMKPMRSVMFVPGHKEGWPAKAVAAGVDGVILDLEDAVPLDLKAQAREVVAASIRKVKAANPVFDTAVTVSLDTTVAFVTARGGQVRLIGDNQQLAAIGDLVGDPRPDFTAAADAIDLVINSDLSAFEPKERWAMDWYYPVLTGAMTGVRAKARLAEGWDRFVMDDRGVRCVSDEQWVTAAETSECAIAHVAAGDRETAKELLLWTLTHRREDGAYWTGVVYPTDPDKTIVRFPAEEYSAYTAAAVIMAADAISDGSPASRLFTVPMARRNAHLQVAPL